MIIELPEKLESALKIQANAHGVSAEGYVRVVLERDLSSFPQESFSLAPFKIGRGALTKLGNAPSAEEIDQNRAEMFQSFGDGFRSSLP